MPGTLVPRAAPEEYEGPRTVEREGDHNMMQLHEDRFYRRSIDPRYREETLSERGQFADHESVRAYASGMVCAAFARRRPGVEVVPVWNKSNREHNLISSEPSSTRAAADAAVKAIGLSKAYYCDADHINLKTVDRFVPFCDFYTFDVADSIAREANQSSVDALCHGH
jgi:hypothetical protein